MTDQLTDLHLLVTDAGVLHDVVIEETAVRGRAHFVAAGAEVVVTIDPEADDEEADSDLGALMTHVDSLLAVSDEHWRGVVDGIASEIEDAVGEVEIAETVGIRDDLTLTELTVYPDAVLATFVAPTQFPDSEILAQLDDDFEIEDVSIAEDVETES